MKQLILSCFLLIRMSERHVSTVWSGMEGFTWRDNSVEFMIPITCRSFDKIKVGDDFIQSRWVREIIRGRPKNWEMKVVRKILREDGETEFDCF